jgi:hypothetical protein
MDTNGRETKISRKADFLRRPARPHYGGQVAPPPPLATSDKLVIGHESSAHLLSVKKIAFCFHRVRLPRSSHGPTTMEDKSRLCQADGKVSGQKLAGFNFFLHTQEALATLRNTYWRMLVSLTILRRPWKMRPIWSGIRPCIRNSWLKELRSCDTNGSKAKKQVSTSALSVP